MEVIGAEHAYSKSMGAKDQEISQEDLEDMLHKNPADGQAQRRRRLWAKVPMKERHRINALDKPARTKAKAQIYNGEIVYG